MSTDDVWPWWQRVLFRFQFLYLVLFNLPFPFGGLLSDQWHGPIDRYYDAIWRTVVPWTGKHLLHLEREITVFPDGTSGDTTYNFVQVFCFAALAAVGTAIWSYLDRERSAYLQLWAGLRGYVRYYAAFTIIQFGAIKVIPTQFPSPPSLDALVEPLGEFSPSFLMWNFFGSSVPYDVFLGGAEMAAGVLLLIPATALLGALLLMGIMANVVMMNFAYDVGVKILGLHLLAMSIWLIAPDARRLANLLIFNRAVSPRNEGVLWKPALGRSTAIGLRVAFVAGVVSLSLLASSMSRASIQRSPLRGIWDVEEISWNGAARPVAIDDPDRWRSVIFDYADALAIQSSGGAVMRYNLELKMAEGKLEISPAPWAGSDPDDLNWKSVIHFSSTAEGRMSLEGELRGQRVAARLRRRRDPQFLLLNRGFRWVNERGYMR